MIYKVDPNGNNQNTGGVSSPWETLGYALKHAEAGDVILLADGEHTRETGGLIGAAMGGSETAPVIVVGSANALVIPDKPIRLGCSWVTLQGFRFGYSDMAPLHIGQHEAFDHNFSLEARGILLRGLRFEQLTSTGIPIFWGDGITIYGCYADTIRSYEAGVDRSFIVARYKVRNLVVRNCQGYDIGSDMVHILSHYETPGSYAENVWIMDSHSQIRRPYFGPLGNVGENGIDIKPNVRNVWVIGNTIVGTRPTVDGQDASGSLSGSGLFVHDDDHQSVCIIDNHFVDCTTGFRAFIGALDLENVRDNTFTHCQADFVLVD